MSETAIATTNLTNDEVNKLIDAMRDTPAPELDQQPAPPDDDTSDGGGGDKDLTLLVYMESRKSRVMVFPRTEDWQWDCECVAEDGAHQPAVLRVHHKNEQGDETISRIVAVRIVAVSEVWS